MTSRRPIAPSREARLQNAALMYGFTLIGAVGAVATIIAYAIEGGRGAIIVLGSTALVAAGAGAFDAPTRHAAERVLFTMPLDVLGQLAVASFLTFPALVGFLSDGGNAERAPEPALLPPPPSVVESQVGVDGRTHSGFRGTVDAQPVCRDDRRVFVTVKDRGGRKARLSAVTAADGSWIAELSGNSRARGLRAAGLIGEYARLRVVVEAEERTKDGGDVLCGGHELQRVVPPPRVEAGTEDAPAPEAGEPDVVLPLPTPELPIPTVAPTDPPATPRPECLPPATWQEELGQCL